MFNNSTFEDLAGIVQYHRKISGLSRAKLAQLAGVGKTVIFDVEHGKKTIRLDSLIKILTVLNITIELQGPLIKTYKERVDEKR